jgi:Flp pilus assembly protein TadD
MRMFARLLPLVCCALALRAETVLVLPFANSNDAHNLDWVGESVAEILIDVLTAEGLDVVRQDTRDEVLDDMGLRRYAVLTRASAMEIAINSDAGIVVGGEFAWTAPKPGAPGKGTVRLTTYILDVHGMRKLGEFTVGGPLEELSQMETSLAWQTLGALRPGVTGDESAFRRNHPAVRIDALEYYVRGLRAQTTQQKHQLLSVAARLAPTFSLPCYQLGKLNFFALKHYGAAAEWFQKVREGDSHYRESLFYLGLSRYNSGDFSGAAAPLRTLAGMLPLPEVLNNLGAVLVRLNDPEALDCFRKAMESDPSESDYAFNAAYTLWRRSDFAPAAEMLRAVLERSPEDNAARMLLERCEHERGPRPGDLRAEALERVQSEYNESAWLALKSMLSPQR